MPASIYTVPNPKTDHIKINDALIAAQGSSTDGAAYEFIDEGLNNRKTYYYQLEDVDVFGASTFHGPEKATPRWIYGNK